jgi:four helix bundle protein
VRREEKRKMVVDKIDKPKDICQRTFEFSVRVLQVCQFLYKKGGPERRLADQLLRAGTSIGANIEEARAGQSRPDFISKNAIALKEARETNYWIRLLVAAQLVPESRLSALEAESAELMKIIGAIVVSSRQAKR